MVNLAGKNVDCRYTKASRPEILKSRLNSVRALAEAVRRCTVPPAVWVQAGSLAVYGDAGPLWCDETAPAGEGFAPEVCQKWETAFFKAPLPPVRRVMLRIGFVLGNEGGALPVLARLAKWFAGAPAGNGRQWVSWIHAHDMDRIFLRAVHGPCLGRHLQRLHRRRRDQRGIDGRTADDLPPALDARHCPPGWSTPPLG